MKKTIEPTKAESEVMHILWDKGEALVQDLVAEMPNPKQAYNMASMSIYTKNFYFAKAPTYIRNTPMVLVIRLLKND